MELKEQIDATLADAKKLPAMPALVNRIQNMLKDPDVDIKALAQEISRDMALTAGVIRLSNSAYYGSRKRIHSVQEAIMALGLETVLTIVLVTISKGILHVPLEPYRLNEKDLWQNSLLTAELCRQIATLKKSVNADVAFTSGLLHDVGRVVLVQFFRLVYQKINIEMQNNPSLRFSALEKKYTGYNHFEISGKVLRAWNFPPAMAEAIENLTAPENARLEPFLSATLHVAHFLAGTAGVGIDPHGMTEALSSKALVITGLTDAELQALYGAIPETMERIQDLLNS